jgi:peptidoglycan/xylan/chitin deacetylase (PgdA/CDA1 family)
VDCIEGRFRQFWEQNGGLAVFGYPITPAGISPAGDGRLLVQYFERVRFEYHPELASPYDVLLGRMGDERLRALNLDWQTLPAALPETPHFFPDTRHAIAHEPFWQHWQNHGLQDPGKSPYERSLALFGFPISEPSIETNATGDVVLTQWFERARFEDHGAKGVLLGLLGAESRPTQSLEPAPVPPPIPEPAPPPVPVPPPAPSPPKAGGNVVYLTFDDGPFGGWTQQILTVLARYNARATFFVIGRQVPAFSGLIQGAAAAGHTFANHTYNHATLVGISRDTFQREVLSTEAVLGPYATKCLRPPGGAMDAAAHAYAAELGYRTLLWDIDPRDWQRPGAAAIADHVLRNTGSGSVVLLHDGGGDRSQTVAALDTILRTLTARGYRFEPIC